MICLAVPARLREVSTMLVVMCLLVFALSANDPVAQRDAQKLEAFLL